MSSCTHNDLLTHLTTFLNETVSVFKMCVIVNITPDMVM